MNHPPIATRVGSYVVTPLTKRIGAGCFSASVSVRRGHHDRIFRFDRCFASDFLSTVFAAQQGRDLVLANQLG